MKSLVNRLGPIFGLALILLSALVVPGTLSDVYRGRGVGFRLGWSQSARSVKPTGGLGSSMVN